MTLPSRREAVRAPSMRIYLYSDLPSSHLSISKSPGGRRGKGSETKVPAKKKLCFLLFLHFFLSCISRSLPYDRQSRRKIGLTEKVKLFIFYCYTFAYRFVKPGAAEFDNPTVNDGLTQLGATLSAERALVSRRKSPKTGIYKYLAKNLCVDERPYKPTTPVFGFLLPTVSTGTVPF
ncbi:hypothetical protein B9Z19DRAFT_647301 [Tuber borchii]|uniref:Uncharacterized protein n=1 Tax=Tuber borchii TaxID=42251 RepID=A0A2T6ZB29_TUBBO|nr:hypothetical protein B9Z19DRAFT_647301 [Tuber borchii]